MPLFPLLAWLTALAVGAFASTTGAFASTTGAAAFTLGAFASTTGVAISAADPTVSHIAQISLTLALIVLDYWIKVL